MIDEYLQQLYSDGIAHDSAHTEPAQRMLNITASTGQFLDLLIRDARPSRILEIGTSNGYSTIWITRAASDVGAFVDTVDINVDKIDAARSNLSAVALDSRVSLHCEDATAYLARCETNRYDFVFLDSDRRRYVAWYADLFRVIANGTLVVDNAISHSRELEAFHRLLDRNDQYEQCVLPIGKGQLVARPRIHPASFG